MSVAANVASQVVPAEHDDLLLEVFAELLAHARSSGFSPPHVFVEESPQLRGDLSLLAVEPRPTVMLDPQPIPQLLQTTIALVYREACELVNESGRLKLSRGHAISLLLLVIACGLCDAVAPSNDHTLTAIFGSALALARTGVNVAN